MLSFVNGISTEQEEARYEDWTAQHPDGLVVNFTRTSAGQHTVHRAGCQTITYRLAEANQAERTRKVCFDSWQELQECGPQHNINANDLNRCGRCRSEPEL